MDTIKWTNEIDRMTNAFKTAFGQLSNEQLNWNRNPETWSIARNIDHLIVVNSTYFPVIKAIRDGSYKVLFIGKVGFMVRFFGKMILSSVQPDRKRKMKTFPIWEPTQSAISELG